SILPPKSRPTRGIPSHAGSRGRNGAPYQLRSPSGLVTAPSGGAFPMNLILFTEPEISQPLPLADPRAIHILQTLRRKTGDDFDSGIVNGSRGKSVIREISTRHLLLEFRPTENPPPLHPVSLLVGLSRPQTMRKILQETTSLGIAELHFVLTEKGEPSYAESKLWSTGEYRRHLIAGAEQAFTT